MRLKWLLSWILLFPLLLTLTGIQIRGSVPKRGRVIIASNHASFLDPPLIGLTAFREVWFLAKPGLFVVSSFFAWLIRSYNALSLQGTAGMRTASRLLGRDEAVVIFPEGTRSKTGTMLPFHIGLGFLAIKQHAPVVPARIINSRTSPLWLFLRLRQLKVIYGAPLAPDGYHDTRADYERFTARVRQAIIALR